MTNGSIDPGGSEDGRGKCGSDSGASSSKNKNPTKPQLPRPRKIPVSSKEDRSRTKMVLGAMAREAAELREWAGAPVTDAITDWLAPHYAQVMHDELAGSEGEERVKLLRSFVQDWALLRRGDLAADRLHIEWERIAMQERFYRLRFRRKTTEGLKALHEIARDNPKAREALLALAAQVQTPFNSDEEWEED